MTSRRCNQALFTLVLPLLSCGTSTNPQVTCNNDTLISGCIVGHCILASRSGPLASGTITLAEHSVPSELQGDALAPYVCDVTLPAGAAVGEITLSIAMDSVPPDGTIFDWSGRVATTLSSTLGATTVSTVIGASGTYGVTHTPSAYRIGGSLGEDPISSTDPANVLRNLESTNAFSAAFFDGTHLLTANGARVLIYDGIPGVNDLPKVVLGQPAFDASPLSVTSASSFGGHGIGGIWSDGNRVVVSNNNRVLIWLSFPTADFAPADVVLGQSDFTSNTANRGGPVTAGTLFNAFAVDSDGTQLLVADTDNFRVLKWSTFPTVVGQQPDIVIGQPSFVSAIPYGGAIPLYLPYGAKLNGQHPLVSGYGGPGLRIADSDSVINPASSGFVFCWPWGADSAPSCAEAIRPAGIRLTPSGGVVMRDQTMNQLLVSELPPSGPSPASFVIGQPDTTRMVTSVNGDAYAVNPARVHASSFGNGYDVGGSSNQLLVADDFRLLVWSHFPTYNFEPADIVVGQPGFATNELTDYRNITSATLADPSDVSISGGIAAVADTANNRVLLFHASDLTTTVPSAFAVVGQPDGASFIANHDLKTVDGAGLSGPRGTCMDGTHLVVSDTENHRVLIWKKVPQQSGTPADIVLGQPDFNSQRPNRGRADVDPLDGVSDADANGLFYPFGIACDGTHLLVADRLNHRVLVWNQFPSATDQPADRVIGQPSFTSVGAHGGQGAFDVTANGFNLPTAIALEGSTLWVADTENNRVVRWDNVFTAPTPGAFIGQAGGTSVSNPNYQFGTGPFRGYASPTPPTSVASVLRPRGIVVANGDVFISESDSNRVHVFDEASLQPIAILGQSDDVTATPNSGGTSAVSLSEPLGLATDGTSLFVSDARNSRLLSYPLAGLSSGAAATHVVGQTSLSNGGFNAATTAHGGVVSAPSGLSLTAASELFVADAQNHRVLAFDTTATPPSVISVIGQSDTNGNQPNSGSGVSASGLDTPRGVWADDQHVVVADSNNNRVLLFDRATSLTSAAVVIGQSTMTTSGPNNPTASAATLASPSGVCSDGVRLAVVDTGNSRLLVWNNLPQQNGATADAILGQPDATSLAPNLGGAQPGTNTLASPGACVFAPEGLYVADTGNNRVLFYSDVSNNAFAKAVLGQLDANSRTPAPSADNLTQLAGPAGLAFDGTNLYVVDRDLGRIVVFGDPQDGAPYRSVVNASDSGYRPTSGIATVRQPFFTSSVFVSDATTNRVFRVDSVSRLLSTSP